MEKVDWRGCLKAREMRETAGENICNKVGADGFWYVWSVKRMTFMTTNRVNAGKGREREKHSQRFSLCSSPVRLQQLHSFPARKKTKALTGFPCSLNFHKAYREMCHILKWLAPCNPLHENWTFMSPVFGFFMLFWGSKTHTSTHLFH